MGLNKTLLAGIISSMGGPSVSPEAQANAILRSFGSNASRYPFATLSGAYQANAGPAAVAVNDPVGLELDAMGTVGPELVTNGDFSAGSTGWFVTGGWTAAGGVASSNGGLLGGVSQTCVEAGKSYVMEFDAVVISGWVVASIGGGGNVAFSTSGHKKLYAPASTIAIRFDTQVEGHSCTITNVSCKEVTGNHATQTTAINRPTLSALYNELTYTTDLNAARWNASAIAYTGGVVIPAATNAQHFFSHNYPDTGTPTKRLRVIAKAAGYQWLGLAVAGGGITMFDVLNGVIGTTQTGGTPTITPIGNGEFVCSVERAYVGQATYIFVQPNDAQSTWTPDGVSGIAVRDFDQRKSGTPASYPQYQRVTGDVANYDTAGFPFYASFNGTNQSLALSSVPFQMADDHCVVACISLSSATLNQGVLYGGAGTGWIASIYADTTNGVRIWYWNDASGSFSLVVGSIALNEVVVVSLRCSSGIVTGRKNGVVAGTIAPTGVFTVTTSGIGTHPSLVSMEGGIYDLQVIKGTVTDAQLLTLEKAAAQRAGLVI